MPEGSQTIMIKTVAFIEGAPPTAVFEVIANQEVRKKWDNTISLFEIIEEHPEE